MSPHFQVSPLAYTHRLPGEHHPLQYMHHVPANRHPFAPPRSATYHGLDAARRRSQSVQSLALRRREPEPGIKCATYPLPDLGPPTERLYGSSPILKLPFEELLWKVEGGPAVVFRRFKVRIHNFDYPATAATPKSCREMTNKSGAKRRAALRV